MSCIEMLLEHNYATRAPIITTLKQLTSDELNRPEKEIGCRSIWELLIHLVETERYWIAVLQDDEPLVLNRKALSTLEDISKVMASAERDTRMYLRELDQDILFHVKSVRWGDQTVSFTVKKALVHMATHEIHHRGLIVGLIRQLGYDPPDVNML
jgi:uncharacterized damage-inducible protein DinB